MSTTERSGRKLVEGQRMNQSAFHALYEATPPGINAELVGGVVHKPSPVGPAHGRVTSHLNGWLFVYQRATKGVEALDNASTALDDLGEVQPDALLRILPEYGGQSGNDRRYIVGAPELVVEVARSSRSIDLGTKRVDYERAGVREYLVRTLEPDEVIWHVREGESLVVVKPNADGIYRSRAFPGLWLDPKALLDQDLDGLITTLERGLGSPEHAAFVARLAEARKQD